MAESFALCVEAHREVRRFQFEDAEDGVRDAVLDADVLALAVQQRRIPISPPVERPEYHGHPVHENDVPAWKGVVVLRDDGARAGVVLGLGHVWRRRRRRGGVGRGCLLLLQRLGAQREHGVATA
jgi:hypothetical protein